MNVCLPTGSDNRGNELYHNGALSGHSFVPDVDAEDFTDFGLDERLMFAAPYLRVSKIL